MRLVLASGSPRRAALLDQLDLDFEVVPPDVDETRLPQESPDAYVERVARDKARAVAAPGTLVVAADTAVVHEGHVMGKPVHPAEARTMLHRLQGEMHEVVTGMAVASIDEMHSLVDTTTVRMLPMTSEEIDSYVNSGEPMDKAGAYALQGQGGLFVESVKGSPFTVIGLPIHLLSRLTLAFGEELHHFSRHVRSNL